MKLASLILATLLSAVTVSGQVSEYIGLRYRSVVPETMLQNGVKILGGALVGDFEAKPVWGISEVKKGKTKMLWLERAAAENDTGVTEWEVMDVLSFPNFALDNELLIGAGPGECTENRKVKEDMAVQVQFLKKQYAYRTIRAWRANIKTGKFVQLDAKKVKCVYSEP